MGRQQYHLGARGRHYKIPSKPRVCLNELTLVGAAVLSPGTQTEIQVVNRSTGSCFGTGWGQFPAKHGFHLADGHQKKVRRNEPLCILLVNMGRKTKKFPRAPV